MTRPNLLRSMDAKVRLDLVSPKPPELKVTPLVVAPRRMTSTLMGRAFGYLLRFEWQRRQPRAHGYAWPAEDAVEQFEHVAPDESDDARAVLGAAKVDYARFVADPTPTPATRSVMAGHAFALARLEGLAEADDIAELVNEPTDPRDVQELLSLLDIVPWEQMTGRSVVLDPPFAPFTFARAEAVVDGRLVAVRTTKSVLIDADDMRALVLRLIHARESRAANPNFPEITELALYSARHGMLWTCPVESIVSHEAFPQVEGWFHDESRRLRRAASRELARAAGGPDAPPPDGRKKAPGWARKRARTTPQPGTNPEGKASVKKGRAAEAAPAPQPQVPRAKPKPRAEGTPPAPADAPVKKKSSRLDWRRGSELQRRRGR